MKRVTIFSAMLLVSGAAMAQQAQTPATDARGIEVVSTPAVAPAGANAPVDVPPGATVTLAPNQASVFTPTESTGDLPPCSKTVTDRCKQTYERKH